MIRGLLRDGKPQISTTCVGEPHGPGGSSAAVGAVPAAAAAAAAASARACSLALSFASAAMASRSRRRHVCACDAVRPTKCAEKLLDDGARPIESTFNELKDDITIVVVAPVGSAATTEKSREAAASSAEGAFYVSNLSRCVTVSVCEGVVHASEE